MPDPIDSFAALVSLTVNPADNAVAVNLDNGNFQTAELCRSVYIGTGGDLTIIMKGGEEVTLRNLPDASHIALRVNTFVADNTTASDIVALW
jgi:hypothetical protein